METGAASDSNRSSKPRRRKISKWITKIGLAFAKEDHSSSTESLEPASPSSIITCPPLHSPEPATAPPSTPTDASNLTASQFAALVGIDITHDSDGEDWDPYSGLTIGQHSQSSTNLSHASASAYYCLRRPSASPSAISSYDHTLSLTSASTSTTTNASISKRRGSKIPSVLDGSLFLPPSSPPTDTVSVLEKGSLPSTLDRRMSIQHPLHHPTNTWDRLPPLSTSLTQESELRRKISTQTLQPTLDRQPSSQTLACSTSPSLPRTPHNRGHMRRTSYSTVEAALRTEVKLEVTSRGRFTLTREVGDGCATRKNSGCSRFVIVRDGEEGGKSAPSAEVVTKEDKKDVEAVVVAPESVVKSGRASRFVVVREGGAEEGDQEKSGTMRSTDSGVVV
ncbi:hypothetical protein HDV00_005393 [Rhizophlyctis rosea]|nr:hypothetical protein HDV00_005393 [Rhizophlyctis rosea]